jgi:6-phosphogluconolactonase/glucosamine-6-phosphate isomerase/deaminase
MGTRILEDAAAVAAEAARLIAAEARAVVAARGQFVVAVSGGRTPWAMLRALADEDVPWSGVHMVQVDERIAPAGDADRNLTHLRESLGPARSPGPSARHAGGAGGHRSRRPRGYAHADARADCRHAPR